MRFCSAVNCMDGRVQLPVIRYLQNRFNVDYVDTITEAGPNLVLSAEQESDRARSVLGRVGISIREHRSKGVAVVGHHGCAGNPAPEEEQIAALREAASFLRRNFSDVEIVALWVDERREVREVAVLPPGASAGLP